MSCLCGSGLSFNPCNVQPSSRPVSQPVVTVSNSASQSYVFSSRGRSPSLPSLKSSFLHPMTANRSNRAIRKGVTSPRLHCTTSQGGSSSSLILSCPKLLVRGFSDVFYYSLSVRLFASNCNAMSRSGEDRKAPSEVVSNALTTFKCDIECSLDGGLLLSNRALGRWIQI